MNIWQSNKWAVLQKSLGNKTFRVNGILVIEKALPLKMCFFEVPRATPDTSFWLKLKKIAAQRNAIFCRIAQDSKHLPEFGLPHKTTAGQRFPEATRIVDLRPEQTAIFAQFSESGRRQIRVAEKNDIVVSESTDLARFAFLSEQTAKRDGFSAHSEAYFRIFLNAFGSDAELLVAKKDGKWLSAGIFVYYEGMGLYYYGASSEMFRKLNAPTLLQWEAMKRAKLRGCSEFDLFGVAANGDSDHKLVGVSRFKRKFGGKVIEYYPETNVIFSKKWYTAYRFARILKGII